MRKIDKINSRENNLRLNRIKFFRPTRTNTISTKLRILGSEVIEAPNYIDLVGSMSDCISFFEKIKQSLTSNPKYIYLSFKDTSVLKAMPLLMIYSIIDSLRKNNQCNTKINIIWSKNRKSVNSFIKNSGKFLTHEERELLLTENLILPILMGDNSRTDTIGTTIIDFILKNYFTESEATAEKEAQIASAINETIENVGRHAYPNIENHEDKCWWLCCNRVEDNLYIAIYDSGVGIPSSLSENNKLMLSRINALYPNEYNGCISDNEKSLSLGKKIITALSVKILRQTLNDGQLIRAAMHTNITSTELMKHGQGSKSIKGLITDDQNSFLLMFSSLGHYHYSKHKLDNEQSITKIDHSIPGTLIQWSI